MDEITPKRTLQSWDEFADLAGRLSPRPDMEFPGAFRGQANASWRLEPTLLRHLREAKMTEEEALDLERDALALFQERAPLHIDRTTRAALIDTMSWWTLMQHHGAPTRLLDWSVSIHVSAYFSVSSHPECDGALWVVNKSVLPRLMNDRHGTFTFPTTEAEIRERFCQSGAPLAVHFFQRHRPHPRMVAQQGLFSVCQNVLGDHESILHGSTPDETSQLFRKYIIPAAQKPQFLVRLRDMDVTASALFPGLDGFARSIGEMIVCSALQKTG